MARKFVKEQLDLALIQESWISSNGKICGLRGISVKILKAPASNRVSACILMRKNLRLSDVCTPDIVAAKIIAPGKERGYMACLADFSGDTSAELHHPPALRKLL